MRIKHLLLSLIMIPCLGLSVVPVIVSAQAPQDTTETTDLLQCPPGSTNPICNQKPFSEFIKIVANTLLYILGVLSVLVIIVSGIRYSTSHGDPKAVQSAKDTLLYAVVGLVVAISAFAIVNFVIGFLPAV